MITHALKFFDTILFPVDESNYRSQKAMEKIGGIKTGQFQKPKQDGSQRIVFIYTIRKNI